MYIAGGPTGSSSASASEKPSASVNLTNNSWHRPGLAPVNPSRRPDTKEREEPSERSSQVRAKSSGPGQDLQPSTEHGKILRYSKR